MRGNPISPAGEAAIKQQLSRKPPLPPLARKALNSARARRAWADKWAREDRGLKDDAVREIDLYAQRLARKQGKHLYPAIYIGQILKRLTNAGIIQLSAADIVKLMALSNDMPAELTIVVLTFLAQHPPLVGNYSGVEAAIRAGAIGGCDNMIRLHRMILDNQRKARGRRADGIPVRILRDAATGEMPRLHRSAVASATVDREAARRQQEAAIAALTKLYQHRHSSKHKNWVCSFLEAAQSLVDAGFPLDAKHCLTIAEISKGMHRQG